MPDPAIEVFALVGLVVVATVVLAVCVVDAVRDSEWWMSRNVRPVRGGRRA